MGEILEITNWDDPPSICSECMQYFTTTFSIQIQAM